MEEDFNLQLLHTHSHLTTVLSSNRVALNSSVKLHPASIFVGETGAIEFVQSHSSSSRAIEIVDYANLIIMPGLIDCNVNLQDGAKEKWEGFDYGTSAAAAGGVTTLADLPIMKRPTMITVKSLRVHQALAETMAKVDIAFIAYLNDENIKKVKKFIDDGVVFGFCSFLSAPLNRKLDEITEKGLVDAVQTISSLDKDMLYYIEPISSEGRHMYAKSPFRKEKLSNRLSQDIPKNLNLMAFAFPDGNEGDNSSASEDEAKPAVLNIERLSQKSASTVTNKGDKRFDSGFLMKPPNLNSNRFEEPSSALIRDQITQLRQDSQNLAVSELMLYETNTSSGGGGGGGGGTGTGSIVINQTKNQKVDDESGSSEDQKKKIMISNQLRIRAAIKVDVSMLSQKPDAIQSATQRLQTKPIEEEDKINVVKKKNNSGSSPRSNNVQKIFKISKDSINYGGSPRQSVTSLQSQQVSERMKSEYQDFEEKKESGGFLSKAQTVIKEDIREITPPVSREALHVMSNPKTDALPVPKRHNSNQIGSQSPNSLSLLQQEGAAQHEVKGKPPMLDVQKRKSSLPGGTSPLMGANQNRQSFVERRKQLMAQKGLETLNLGSPPIIKNQSSPAIQAKQNSSLKNFSFQGLGSKIMPFQLTPQKEQDKMGFGLNLIEASNQADPDEDEESLSPSVYNSLAPLNTRKKDEDEDQNARLQQSYLFFLSLQPVSFEENGVAQVEKALTQVPNYSQEGCRIHLINLSSNAGLAKVREIKKKPEYQNKITYEMTPHHLMFTSQDIQDKETIMKCCPPIRDQREQTILYISFKKKYFDAISSAHFPVDPIYKSAGDGNFFKAFNGVSTLGFTLQAMWTLFKRQQMEEELNQEISQEQYEEDIRNYMSLLVLMLCERPAAVLGLDKAKGSIIKGKQCDLVVFDPDAETTVSSEDIYNRHQEVCIYKGKKLYGRVKDTYLRGELIFRDGDQAVLREKNRGKVLRRQDYRE